MNKSRKRYAMASALLNTVMKTIGKAAIMENKKTEMEHSITRLANKPGDYAYIVKHRQVPTGGFQ